MASANKVILIGNLTRDPELRHTSGGTTVGDLGIAVNSSYKAKDGKTVDEVCYVDVVVWGRTAENCSEYLQKGSPVYVEGKLQLDTWETSSGEKKSKLRVKAENVQFLNDNRKTNEHSEAKANTYQPTHKPSEQEPDSDTPF